MESKKRKRKKSTESIDAAISSNTKIERLLCSETSCDAMSIGDQNNNNDNDNDNDNDDDIRSLSSSNECGRIYCARDRSDDSDCDLDAISIIDGKEYSIWNSQSPPQSSARSNDEIIESNQTIVIEKETIHEIEQDEKTGDDDADADDDKEKLKLSNKNLHIKEEYDDDDEEEEEEEELDLNANRSKLVKWCASVAITAKPAERNRKDLILEVARDMFARHKFNSLKMLMHSMLPQRRIPPFVLMKYFFAILYSEDDGESKIEISREQKHFITQFVFLLTDEKYEFLLELTMYILANEKRRVAEKPFLIDIRTQIEERMRRTRWLEPQRILRQTYRLYEEYLDFVEWRNRPAATPYMRAVSQRLAKMLKRNLSRIIDGDDDQDDRAAQEEDDAAQDDQQQESSESSQKIPAANNMNLDIGVLMLLQLYDQDDELLSALELLRRYAARNPDLLTAHIYLYEFVIKFPDIPCPEMDSIRIDALKRIVRLSPDSRYTIRLLNESPTLTRLTEFERFVLLLDFVDYVHNFASKRAWKMLRLTAAKYVDRHRKSSSSPQIEDEEERNRISSLFAARLPLMANIHFKRDELNRALPRLRAYNRARNNSDSDYSSDVSIGSARRPPPPINVFDCQILLYKGQLLQQIAAIGIELPETLDEYRRTIAQL